MMKRTTYPLILGTVLLLSFCQGRNASITDPTGGANQLTAGQYAAMGNTGTVQPEIHRTQDFTYSFPYSDWTKCGQEYASANDDMSQVSTYCQHVLISGLYQMGYLKYGQDEITLNLAQPGMAAGAHPASFTFNRNQLLQNNSQWTNGYLGQMGAGPYNVNGPVSYPSNFQYPFNNMQQFCGGNTGVVTNMTYANPCGQLNWRWTTLYTQANQGRMQFLTGDYNGAGNIYAANGPIQSNCGGIFRGAVASRTGFVPSRLSTQGQNANNITRMYEKQFKNDWKAIKQKPKQLMYRAGDAGLNLLDSTIERVFSGFEAGLNQQATNNYLIADWNNAAIAYNNSLLLKNQQAQALYNDMTLTSSTLGAMAADPENPCPPQDTFKYVVSDEAPSSNGYVIQCPYSN